MSFTNSEKGAFSEDSGNIVITRWKLPFNSSTPQSRSISITLSGTGSAGTVIMEYISIMIYKIKKKIKNKINTIHFN